MTIVRQWLKQGALIRYCVGFLARLLLALGITVFGVALVRSVMPTLSGIPTVFPSNISEALVAEDFNKWRLEQARITLMNTSEIFMKRTEEGGDLRVSVIASGRVGGFLTQTLASLASAFYNSTLQVSFFLCDVSPRGDTEINELSKNIEVVRKQQSDEQLDAKASYEERRVKEGLDYWWCLGKTRQTRYSLIVEDDVIAVPQFSTLIESAIRKMDERTKVDYVKLYHPGDLRAIPYYFQLVTFSLLISGVVTAALWRSANTPFTILLTVFLIYHLRVHYTYQFFADLRYAISGSAYWGVPESCCTPAVLYRDSKLPAMLSYFSALATSPSRNQAKDDLLDDSPFVARQSDTNYVVHIGFFSAIRNVHVNIDSLKYLKRRNEFYFPNFAGF